MNMIASRFIPMFLEHYVKHSKTSLQEALSRPFLMCLNIHALIIRIAQVYKRAS